MKKDNKFWREFRKEMNDGKPYHIAKLRTMIRYQINKYQLTRWKNQITERGYIKDDSE